MAGVVSMANASWRDEWAPWAPPGGRLLALGLGNELLSDDGVGIHAIRALQEEPSPGVTAVELGTAILHGLEYLETADRVLVLDAVKGGAPPGTVYFFEAEKGRRPAAFSSVHALGLCEAANLLLRGRVPPMTVVGVEPARLDYGFELSSPVRRALRDVIWLSRRTLAGWRRAGEKPRIQEDCSIKALSSTT